MARPASLESATRLEVRVPDALVGRIDDYRFANRLSGRSEAVRDLVERGLDRAHAMRIPGGASGAEPANPEDVL